MMAAKLAKKSVRDNKMRENIKKKSNFLLFFRKIFALVRKKV